MSQLTLDFEDLNDALTRLNADIEAAELHGTLSGLLCAVGNSADKHLDTLIPKGATGDALDQQAYKRVRRCSTIILAQFNDIEMPFEPLLPDEDEDLQTRTEALCDWSHGFLLGLAMAGVKDYDKLPKEASEFCQDLLEISKATSYEHAGNDEDEAAYYELVEYLRVGVLLIYEMLNPVSGASSASEQLH